MRGAPVLIRAGLGFATVLALAGCTVSPEYRAFVRASRANWDVVAPVYSRAVVAEAERLPEPARSQVRSNRLGLAEDYEAALRANEERVGLPVGGAQ